MAGGLQSGLLWCLVRTRKQEENMKDINTINIPLKSEFNRDIKALKRYRKKDNICKYSLVFVAVIGVILTGLMLAGWLYVKKDKIHWW